MSLDQRGFKTLIQQEAAEFLSVKQRLLNATVRTVAHSQDGVTLTLANGTTLSADYALCTFSLGVLQNDDVQFHPPLPRELLLSPSLFLLLISGTVISFQARSYSGDGYGHIHENISPISPQVLVFNGGMFKIPIPKLHWYLIPSDGTLC